MSKPRKIREWVILDGYSKEYALLCADCEGNTAQEVRAAVAAELAFYSRVATELLKEIERLEAEGDEVDIGCVARGMRKVLERAEKET